MDNLSLTHQLIAALKPLVTERVFGSHVAQLSVVELRNDEVVLGTPKESSRLYLSEKLMLTLRQALQELLEKNNLVVMVTKVDGLPGQQTLPVFQPASAPLSAEAAAPMPRVKKKVDQESGLAHSASGDQAASDLQRALNPHYTFENFIVGKASRMAHAASLAVAEKPGQGQIYNPLYVYCNPGLGKTHLLHAIAHRVMELHPGKVVRLLNSEQFMAEFVDMFRHGKPTSQFRQKYRNCDVFIVDDIEQIAGREATAEELFHTFNELMTSGSQIVVASDTDPRKLEGFHTRLTTRLAGGLTVSIDAPDFETRLAILQHRAAWLGLATPKGVLERLAQGIKTNVRDLISALNQIHAHADLMDQTDMEAVVEKYLTDTAVSSSLKTQKVTCEEIIVKTAETCGVTVTAIKSKRRTPKMLVLARHIAMYLCRNHTQLPLAGIGEYFNTDHSSIQKSHAKMHKVNDPEVLAVIEKIKAELGLE